MHHIHPPKSSLSASDLADQVFKLICSESLGACNDWKSRMKELHINPFSGWCKSYCVAILLLAKDASSYDLLYVDEESCEESGTFVHGAECHFWLAHKDCHERIVDPTYQQFILKDVPLPYEYLGEDEIVVVTQPLTESLVRSGIPFAIKLAEFISSNVR